MSHFIKSRLGEYIACVMICAGFVFPVCAGFVLTDPFTGIPPLGMLVIAVILGVVYLFSYKRTTVVAGVITAAVAAATMVIYIQIADPLGDEEENSVFIFLLVAVVVSVLVFLLTRTRPGTVVAAILGNFIFVGSKFLAFPAQLWSYFVLLAGCAVMFLLRFYRSSALKAQASKVRNLKYFIQSAVVTIIALGIAVGLYFAVIRPISPPTYDLQLISILRNMDIMEVFGVASEREVYDPDLASGQIRDGSEFAENEGEDENDETEQSEEEQATLQEWIQNSAFVKNLRAVTYRLKEHSFIYLIAIPVIIIVAIFVIRLLKKRAWRRRVQGLSKEDGIRNYYRFFISRLKRAGIKREDTVTLYDYAKQSEHQLEPFAEGESSFSNLTDIYCKVNYGKCQVTDEEYALFESFYDRFHRNLRQEMGLPKYLLNIFRI